MSSALASPAIRYKRYTGTGETNLATDLPDAVGVVGIVSRVNAAFLFYDEGTLEEIIATSNVALISTVYFPFVMPINGTNRAGVAKVLRCKGDNVGSDYTIIYIDKIGATP